MFQQDFHGGQLLFVPPKLLLHRKNLLIDIVKTEQLLEYRHLLVGTCHTICRVIVVVTRP